MTPDPVTALVAFLKADAGVASLAGDRVFGIELPAAEAAGMPRKAIVLRRSGGAGLVRGYAELGSPRIDLFAYGETPYEASRVELAAHQALADLKRVVVGGVLVHWCEDAGGAADFRDPDTNWPASWRSWQVLFSEAPVAA